MTDMNDNAGDHGDPAATPAPQEPLRISERLFGEMVEHLMQSRPNEGCGLIAFDASAPVHIYPGTNILKSPTRYRMDDVEVLRAVDDMARHNWWLGAIYHSHPNSPAVPSTTDLREANWPDALMIIVSLMDERPEARVYRVQGQRAYVEIGIEIYPERASWLSALKRWGSGWSAHTPGYQPAWQPVGAALVGYPQIVMTSGSDQEPVSTETDQQTAAQANDRERRAVVGILGGMGPLATADLYRKIIELTPAANDQEHLPVVIYADPRIPDRTDALLHDGDDPTPWLIHGARALMEMGADFIVMPCNTAHAFLPQVQPAVDRPILSMIDAAADEIRDLYPDAKTVGLLATDGTISVEIYQQALSHRGVDVIVPDDDVQQRCVMPAIRAVKAGTDLTAANALLAEAAEHLVARSADVLLAACTEIPVVLNDEHVSVPLVDATTSLARTAVATARHLDEVAQWETSTTGWGLGRTGT
jgi:aspartate racemase